MNETQNEQSQIWMPHDQFKKFQEFNREAKATIANIFFGSPKKKRKRKPVYSAKAPKHDQSSTN